MISCRDAQHLFDRYLDGELSPQMHTELHAHRINCPTCQMELAIMEACGDVVGLDKREPQLSDSFTDQVMMVYRANQRRSRSWRRIAAWITMPTAAAASLALAVMWWTSSVAPRSEPSPGRTAVLGTQEGPPESNRTLLMATQGTKLSPEAKKELDATPAMSSASFMEAMLSPLAQQAHDTLESARRGAEDLQLLIRVGLSSTGDRLATEHSAAHSLQSCPRNDSNDGRGQTEAEDSSVTDDPNTTRMHPARSPDPL